ncbi:MAG: COG3014 family protein [Nitrospiraceae bacterium]
MLVICWVFIGVVGCGPSINYALIEDSLRANNPQRADEIVERAESEYGSKSRVLYGMDRGMTLHLAAQYSRSNAVLEKAEDEVDRLYTRKIRTESTAFLTNDTSLPYEGDPYEQVFINVVKALNYAALGQFEEALVEARRIDNRLNVLSDQVRDKSEYRDDAFARYLTGMLYEAFGDVNNAFIAYRKAYETYDATRAWSRTPIPAMLRSDLLRVTDALHLSTEFEDYRRAFPETVWQSNQEQQSLAQVIVISYNGRAPRKEDLFIDVPVSLDALQLVLLNRGVFAGGRRDTRGVDTALYGLNGRVVRVAIPRLVPQKTQVAYEQVQLVKGGEAPFMGRTEVAQNITAQAEARLSKRLPGITTKAVARAAMKYAMAEGATYGARSAAGKDNADWVGLLVSLISHGFAVASEEADKRSWRTLPDEIHLARLWVPPGDYEVRVRPVGRQSISLGPDTMRVLTLRAGETKFLIERVMP